MKTFQLFLGRNIPVGPEPVVTDRAFREWQAEVLDDMLEGYTLQDAQGYWHGDRESTKVLTFTGTRDTADTVAKSYCKWFNQEAVGLIELPPMEFLTA